MALTDDRIGRNIFRAVLQTLQNACSLPATCSCYTPDGMTEARNAQDQEFGEARLLDCVRTPPHLSAPALLDVIVAAVLDFSGAEQETTLP